VSISARGSCLRTRQQTPPPAAPVGRLLALPVSLRMPCCELHYWFIGPVDVGASNGCSLPAMYPRVQTLSCSVNVPEMGGDNAEKYQGFEAGFRLHVSATYAAVKVRRCPDSPQCSG
jgi:hypothetical protein